MAALTVTMVLCLIVASNALAPLSSLLLDPSNLIDITKGVLDNGLTACNNYTYLNVPVYKMDGLYYILKRSPGPGKDELRCGSSRYQSIFGTNIALHTFKGIYPASGPFERKYLDVQLSNGQFRAIDLNDTSGETTFDVVAFECNVGYIVVMCRWDPTAPIPINLSLNAREQFPNASVIGRLMDAGNRSSAPVDKAIDVDQTGCPPLEPYKPLTIWNVVALLKEIIFSARI